VRIDDLVAFLEIAHVRSQIEIFIGHFFAVHCL
jgi:hypothetical protein